MLIKTDEIKTYSISVAFLFFASALFVGDTRKLLFSGPVLCCAYVVTIYLELCLNDLRANLA